MQFSYHDLKTALFCRSEVTAAGELLDMGELSMACRRGHQQARGFGRTGLFLDVGKAWHSMLGAASNEGEAPTGTGSHF